VTFERGSKVSHLGDFAFEGCARLKSLIIPASVRHFTGLAMAGSSLSNVTVDENSRFFKVSGGFVVDFDGTSLAWHFGEAARVTISSEIVSISAGCFRSCGSLLSVRFETDCRVSTLGESALCYCFSIESICIPSPIETISAFCFRRCDRLSSLTFEPNSKISKLGESAFEDCSALQSIYIPASLEKIPKGCFKGCRPFEFDIRIRFQDFKS
jgi:hypothetical protein